MEQFEERAVLQRNFQVQRPSIDGTLESAWLNAKAAVEVMLSGKDTEDIQARIAIIFIIMLYILFLVPETANTAIGGLYLSLKGGRKK